MPFKIRPFLVFVRAQWCWQNPLGFALMNHSWKFGKLKFWSCPANPQLLVGFLRGSLGLFLFNILVPSMRSSESRLFRESISSQIQCISKIVEVWDVLPSAMFTVLKIKGHLFGRWKSPYIRGLCCNGTYLNYLRICLELSEDWFLHMLTLEGTQYAPPSLAGVLQLTRLKRFIKLLPFSPSPDLHGNY